MTSAYFSTAYFAPIPYFWHLNRVELAYIETGENYVKQSWRNRCLIATANGSMTLSLPVEHENKGKVCIKDIRLSTHGNWQHLHWISIQSAYNSSPFFEYYQDDIRPFFEEKPAFLFDFNEKIRQTLCKLIPIQTPVKETNRFAPNAVFPPKELDFCHRIHPKVDVGETGFNPKPYYQVFDRKFGFIPNLSILDLLFNMGPESLLYL